MFLGNLGKDGILCTGKLAALMVQENDCLQLWKAGSIYVGPDGRFKSEAVPSLCRSFLVAKSLLDSEHRKRHGGGLDRCEADLEGTVSSQAHVKHSM